MNSVHTFNIRILAALTLMPINRHSHSKLSAYCVNSNIIQTWAKYLNDDVFFSLLSSSSSFLLLFLMFQISRHCTFLSKIECALRYVLGVDFIVSFPLFTEFHMRLLMVRLLFLLHFIHALTCVSSIETSYINAFFIWFSLTTRRQNIVTEPQSKRNYLVFLLFPFLQLEITLIVFTNHPYARACVCVIICEYVIVECS